METPNISCICTTKIKGHVIYNIIRSHSFDKNALLKKKYVVLMQLDRGNLSNNCSENFKDSTVESIRIRSFSGRCFPAFSSHSVSPYSVRNAGKYGPEKSRIRTLFTQCLLETFSKASVYKQKTILDAIRCILIGFFVTHYVDF